MNRLLLVLLIVSCWGCTHKGKTEKHQKNRNNIVDVRDRVRKIETGDIFLTNFVNSYILDKYLIVSDYKSFDKLIYLFDKTTFKYITSVGDRGQGPHEIANLGRIGINEAERIFYVTDHGKQKIFSFELDSVLNNPSYLPKEKVNVNKEEFPLNYEYINDTLSIGLFGKVINDFDYMPIVAKWNMKTGEITPMKYLKHPEIERKRVSFAVSLEKGIYVECYWYHDLLTIGYLNGDFKCNVYGSKWNNATANIDGYFENVIFCKDKIVTSYLGKKRIVKGKHGEQKVIYPTQLMVFDIEGNYLQTLETGHPIINFCYDKEHNRIIMTLEDEILFAYLDLTGII